MVLVRALVEGRVARFFAWGALGGALFADRKAAVLPPGFDL